MITPETRSRVAKALGWSAESTTQFSLPALRELVRTVDLPLADELSEHIRSGQNLIGEPRKVQRRR